MSRYRVSFFKTLLSSDGHPFKCLQLTIEIPGARNTDRAIKTAKRQYERLRCVPDWTLHADTFEVEIDGKKTDCQLAGARSPTSAGSQ
jgi:hypothetical protein